jgi:hypothetical protein
VAANNNHAGASAAIGKRKAQRRRRCRARGHARNDFEGNSGLDKSIDFLGKAPEDCRIAPVQSDHFQASPRRFDHSRVNL